MVFDTFSQTVPSGSLFLGLKLEEKRCWKLLAGIPFCKNFLHACEVQDIVGNTHRLCFKRYYDLMTNNFPCSSLLLFPLNKHLVYTCFSNRGHCK